MSFFITFLLILTLKLVDFFQPMRHYGTMDKNNTQSTEIAAAFLANRPLFIALGDELRQEPGPHAHRLGQEGDLPGCGRCR